MVLLKAFDEAGFVFFSNYGSQKGNQLAANPHAALLFYWPTLERQVRIEGRCEQIQANDSDSYFLSRPRNAQLGAVVSKQSQVVSDRGAIDESYRLLAKEVGDSPIKRPEHWGGYRVVPERFEFWQGRESRLHDRIRYVHSGNGWRTERLWP
jgi:pyridoxamine 5'-phosphate oxidase